MLRKPVTGSDSVGLWLADRQLSATAAMAHDRAAPEHVVLGATGTLLIAIRRPRQ